MGIYAHDYGEGEPQDHALNSAEVVPSPDRPGGRGPWVGAFFPEAVADLVRVWGELVEPVGPVEPAEEARRVVD